MTSAILGLCGIFARIVTAYSVHPFRVSNFERSARWSHDGLTDPDSLVLFKSMTAGLISPVPPAIMDSRRPVVSMCSHPMDMRARKRDSRDWTTRAASLTR